MAYSVGLILGSGHAHLALDIVARSPTKTPFGEPSSPILVAAFGEFRVACIARHGEQHGLPPHEVNYRANLWALHQHGVRQCIGLNAVGAISPGLKPGELAIPDQLIDYTWGRAHTFHRGDNGKVVHIDFTEPFDPILRSRIAGAAHAAGHAVCRGTYAAVQGPRLETAAEIDRLEQDGCTMVGMTAMPEAALARELDIAYAVCAMAVNHAAGRGPDDLDIHAQLQRYLVAGGAKASAVLERLMPELCAVG
jgi:5'-deoxy-5'-methylthioadenosine phosphorylase